jgi:hypothetical protein
MAHLPLGVMPRLSLVVAALSGAGGVVGCTPSIGDKCNLSTDCSIQGNRLCDTSQPAGYCTVLGCTADTCPDNAACVEFGASVPGCPYDDYHAPSRAARAMCMKACGSDSDCRQSDGYVCRDPRKNPWGAVLLDKSRSRSVCIVAPMTPPNQSSMPAGDAAVCSYARQPGADAMVDGTVPPEEAGADAEEAAVGEAAPDVAALDAESTGGDAGDSSAGTAGDAPGDQAGEASATDAPGPE